MTDVSTLRFRPEVLFKDMGEEGVLLNPSNSSYFRLNEMGLRIFRVLAEEKPAYVKGQLENLVTEVARESAMDPNTVRQDVDAFIEQLVSHQFFQ